MVEIATTDTLIFWTVFCIVFFVNLIVPVVYVGLGSEQTQYSSDEADVSSPPSVGTLTAFNLLFVPFWTFAMPLYMNLFIMVPLRVLGWIVLIRMLRGVGS